MAEQEGKETEKKKLKKKNSGRRSFKHKTHKLPGGNGSGFKNIMGVSKQYYWLLVLQRLPMIIQRIFPP